MQPIQPGSKKFVYHLLHRVSVLAVALTLMFFSPAPLARADGNPDEGWTRVDETLPIALNIPNSCNGDAVTLNGQGTLTTETKIQPDGTTDIRTTVSISLTGTGSPSGADYTLSDSSVTHVTGVGTLPFSLFINRLAKLVGTGVPDLYVHAIVHVTINADFTFTHDMDKVTIDCIG
jgi:hypothetical protein